MISLMDESQWPFTTTEGGEAVTIVGDQLGPKNPSAGHTRIFGWYGSSDQLLDTTYFTTDADDVTNKN